MVIEEVTNCGRKINVTISNNEKIWVCSKENGGKILCNNITKQLSKFKYLVYVVTDQGRDYEIKLK